MKLPRGTGKVLEAQHAWAGESCGQATVEGLRNILQDVLEQLAGSPRRRDPVVALKIACKEASLPLVLGGKAKRAGRN